jgi:hypothetical protein
VLRRIFGPKWEEGIGLWRKLRSEELLFSFLISKYYLRDQGGYERDLCNTHG